MPPEFVNRKPELAALERAWSREDAQLITIWGRRRVGKSALLSAFARGKRAVYAYGTRTSERAALDDLASAAAAVTGSAYPTAGSFRTWDDALSFLAELAKTERLLVVLDEFSYMTESSPGLDTVVQRWWDHNRDATNIMVVLSSSALSFVASLTGYRGALYGRRTGQLDLQPFDYFDASFMTGGLDPIDRVRTYACFGGLPAYLRHWRAGRSLRDNVVETTLAPDHMLFNEPEDLLRTEFHQEALYSAILRAIAAGKERPGDIAAAVGKRSAADVSPYLQRLVEMRFVKREVPVTESGHPSSRRSLYRLADPYLRFWFRFVAPNRAPLHLGSGARLWEQSIAPALDEFVGRTTWEEVCQQHLWRRVRAGRPPARFTELGRWWDNDTEVDIVGIFEGAVVLAGECKWSNQVMTERDLADLQQKASRLALSDTPTWVLASRAGFHPALQARAVADRLLLVTPDDIYDQIWA